MTLTGSIIASVCLAYPAAFGLAWIVTGWKRPKARTKLGRRILRLRRRVIASGQPLIGWDELERKRGGG